MLQLREKRRLGGRLSLGLGPTNPRPIAVVVEPFSASVNNWRALIECLLLPPRSAPVAAPDRLTPNPSTLTTARLLLAGASRPP